MTELYTISIVSPLSGAWGRVHPILSYAPGELDVRYTMPAENIALA